MDKEKQIFISYSWKDEEIVDEIDNTFKSIGINILRDKREVKFKESIKDYMKRIRKTDYVLIVISDSFLKSPNCMYEVMELIKDENFKDRILPIILEDAHIFDSKNKSGFIKYWKDACNNIEQDSSSLPNSKLETLTINAKHYDKILNNIVEFITAIIDMRHETFENLQRTNFKNMLEYFKFDNADLLEKLFEIESIKEMEQQDLAIYNFIDIHHDYAEGFYFRGYIEHKRKSYDKSIESFSKAIELKPDYAYAYNNRGIVYGERGNYDRAMEDFTRALELNPDDAGVYYNLGIVCDDAGNYAKAIEEYTNSLELNPDDADAYFNRGIVHKHQGDYDKAIEDYTKAIELKPDSADAFYSRGNAYRHQFEYNKAIEDFTKAIELNPEYVYAYNNRGLAYDCQGNYERALEDLTKAIELKPDDSDAYINRGIAYKHIGKYENATEDYTKAIELKPGV